MLGQRSGTGSGTDAFVRPIGGLVAHFAMAANWHVANGN